MHAGNNTFRAEKILEVLLVLKPEIVSTEIYTTALGIFTCPAPVLTCQGKWVSIFFQPSYQL